MVESGIVNNVKSGLTMGLGSYEGYRFDSSLSAFAGYQSVRDDVNLDDILPLRDTSSTFDSCVIANLIIGNLAY